MTDSRIRRVARNVSGDPVLFHRYFVFHPYSEVSDTSRFHKQSRLVK